MGIFFILYSILVKSSKLKLLDLGGCWSMEDMTPLLGLPFTELEQLYLSSSPIRLNNLLGPLLQKVIYYMVETINIMLKI